MKNVNENTLCRAICLDAVSFEEDVDSAFGEKHDYDWAFDGVTIYPKADDTSLDGYDVCKKLSEYYDINVTSFHTDNNYPAGVWIIFED